ncbi:F-box/kelch-repeat protein At3g23880-like [Arachis duranensis]|uniref:F-box/kelch-repeat protein At3g23880-like n=1 Tax=Arachis duranensis TaxID=130453 RepID=A0A6P4BZU1_ARADU|nr:F-box/kelch-repeat protein At3g23880-like [Arachis duranensis]
MEQPHDYDEMNRKPLRVTINAPKRLLSSTVTPSQPPSVLPDELLTEILLRLPAKLLLRLRCVCRSWRTLISSSNFAKEHVQRSIAADPSLSGPRVAYHHSWEYKHNTFGDFSLGSLFENPSEPPEVVFFEERRRHEIIGSCNGLLCLHESVDTLNNHVMLWNPCTGLTSHSLQICGFIWISGFGHDHVNDVYKLVTTVYQKQTIPHTSATRIYTFCQNPSIRQMQDIPFRSIYGDGKGVFVPGTATLNWIRQHGARDFMVLSLDLVNETFSEFSLPPKDPDNKTFFFPHLCVLRNCLAVCFNHEKTHWSVWLMEEYGVPQSWTKLVTIPCHPRLGGDHLCPLYIWGNNVLVTVASSKKRVLYNLDNESFEFPVLKPTTTTLSLSTGLEFHIYHESLVSPSFGGFRGSSSRIWLIKD